MLALAVLGACDTAPSTSSTEPETARGEVARQVEALGFRGDMVQDFGDYVVVEGDIRLEKSQLLAGARAPLPAQGPLGPRLQYRTTNLVGSPRVYNLTINLAGLNAQPAWQAAAREAITH
ncbi:MAG: hypothetical protein JO040_00540 [Gemmatimonadetes bacterium]|nr:hypothetical protein [Gemmatimonadota bacterium]